MARPSGLAFNPSAWVRLLSGLIRLCFPFTDFLEAVSIPLGFPPNVPNARLDLVTYVHTTVCMQATSAKVGSKQTPISSNTCQVQLSGCLTHHSVTVAKRMKIFTTTLLHFFVVRFAEYSPATAIISCRGDVCDIRRRARGPGIGTMV